VDNPFKNSRIISFCTGSRQLERGIERVIGNTNTICYVENETFPVFNLVAQMEQGVVDPAPIWTDCKTFPSTYFHGKVHGITGGYPCQPFSKAGLRKGQEDPRHLWPYLRRHIEAIRPVWCFFENVHDHITLGFDTVYKELRDLGYAVECGVFSAEEVGAPHTRKRIYILAVESSYLANSDGFGIIESLGGRQSELINEDDETGTYELAHTNSSPAIGNSRNLSGETEKDEGTPQGENRERNRNEFEYSGKELANSHYPGQPQPYIAEITGEKEQRISNGSNTEERIQWPSRPGEPQFGWEEPRTIKPGMGCTVNGYNFAENILRMLGNGVVEQTAEVAFRNLLYKHFK
jgi:DNA (cytosine-5)-methyltransferase 1